METFEQWLERVGQCTGAAELAKAAWKEATERAAKIAEDDDNPHRSPAIAFAIRTS
jgi:hypothetical protein